jgi:hypothetical protein
MAKKNNSPYTVHGVLAGAYRGRDIGERALLNHASQDDGRTALCRKVKADSLCDWPEAEVTCQACLQRIATRGLVRTPVEDLG